MARALGASPLSIPHRRQLEELCDEYERGLRDGNSAAAETYLARMPQEAHGELLRELAAVHLAFLMESGKSVRIEDLISHFPALAERPADLVELIVADVGMRRERGQAVSVAEYFDRFPACRELLAARLTAEANNEPVATVVQRRCPQCQAVVPSVAGDDSGASSCPLCGSSIPLRGGPEVSWAEEKLPRLGRFELLRAVGRGAFGTVYQAHDSHLGRTVAVKVPRSGTFLTPDDESRFVREARNVARLQHPGIVRVYDVGRADGFPFIVTEFVEGISLADALTGYRFRPQESAQILAELAEALAHSHEQGVIHRDVKPSNIMLEFLPGTAMDGATHSRPSLGETKYRPRLTDFGLARRDDGEATVTRDGQVIGTPAYMSPEQARGDNDRVDGRSDLYGLGTVLYHLLTSATPFRGTGRAVLQQVMYDEPRPPRLLNDAVPRDLEKICLKCLEKEPDRRYHRAEELAADLRRYLRGEPVLARSVGRIERAWRWCRRNPMVAALEAAIALLLLSISVASVVAAYRFSELRVQSAQAAQVAIQTAVQEREQRQRAEQAEQQALRATQRANQEAVTAKKVADFLVNVFQSADPVGLEGVGFNAASHARRELLARDVLDQGAQQIQQEFPQPTLTKAELLDAIGFVYCNLGLYPQAQPMLEEALAIRERLLPAHDDKVALSLFHVGWLYQDLTEYDAAEPLYARALAIRQQQFGGDSLEVAEVKFRQAWMCLELALHDEAEASFREVADIRRRHLPAGHRDITTAQTALAITLLSAGRTMEAFTIAVRNLESSSDAVETVNQYILARTFRGARDFERADKGYQTTLSRLEAILGSDHLLVALLLGDFAGMLREKGDLVRAKTAIQRAIAIGQRTLPTHPRMIEAQRTYADALVSAGRVDEAVGLFDQALRGVRARRHPSLREQADLLLAKARALRNADRLAESLEPYQAVVRLGPSGLGKDFWTAVAQEAADALMAGQRFADAAPLLRPFLAELEGLEEGKDVKQNTDRVSSAALRAKVGRCLFLAGDLPAAREELLASCEHLLQHAGRDAAATQAAIAWLIELLEQQGETDLVSVYRKQLKDHTP